MTEFDFDELDQAMNSLLSQRETSDSSATKDDTVNQGQTSRPGALRRQGKFMDVMPAGFKPSPIKSEHLPTAEKEVSTGTGQNSVQEVARNDEPADSGVGSPFIADAQVEKRPLGMPYLEPTGTYASSVESEPVISNFDRIPANEPIPAVDRASDDPVENYLPDEFHDELMDIEAQAQEGIASATPPVSIARQYATSDNTVEAEHASIYDIDLPKVEKVEKKGYWKIALIIIGLMILGVVGGAVAYLLTGGTI